MFSFLEDVTELILHNFKERWLLWRTGGTRPAIHELTPARPPQKPSTLFQGEVVNMHIVWSTGLQGENGPG